MSQLTARKGRRLVLQHASGLRWLMAGGATALLAEVAFRVIEPWPMKFVLDALARSLGAKMNADGPQASLQLLLAAGAATIVIVALRAACNFLATVAFALVGSRIATRLRRHVFDHVQRLSDRFHSSSRTGDLVQRLVGDVGRLQEVAVTAGLPLLANLITMVVMAVVMAWLDLVLALVVLDAFLIFWLFSRRSSPRITAASRKTRKGEGQLANTAQESLGSIRVVQAYGLESMMIDQFSKANESSLKNGVQAKRLAAGLERSTDVLVGVATAAVLCLGGWRVLQGVITPGDLVIFTTYLKTAMKPLRDMAKYTGRIARATASAERVADLLDEPLDITDSPNAVPLAKVPGAIMFNRVTAGYDDQVVLEDISAYIPAGQKVAIVGPSGGGKSTLVSLLLRLRDPLVGSISFAGLDLREYKVADLRANIAIVLQESVLFTGTLGDNIRYGRPDASDAEVARVVKLAQLESFVQSLPEGLDTLVGERGATMSGGQRQRVAIARAMLRNARIVVLDEATTGLDPENAALVQSALDQLCEGATTVTITHDAQAALTADRVWWIENHGIVLDGSPSDLLEHPDRRFAAWVAQQHVSEATS